MKKYALVALVLLGLESRGMSEPFVLEENDKGAGFSHMLTFIGKTPFLSDLKYFLSHAAHICEEISRIAMAAYQRDAISYYTKLHEDHITPAEVDEDGHRIPSLPKLPAYKPVQLQYGE